GYVAAFLLYASIYQLKTRSIVSAPAIVLATLLLAARQLRIAQLFSSGGASGTPAITNRYPALTTAGMGTAAARAARSPRPEPARPVGDPSASAAATTRTASATEMSSFRAIAPPRGHAMVPGWPQVLVYAAMIALAAGEITWALNYWPLNGLFAGAFLLAS